MRCKKYTDGDLVLIYKNLNKIIKVVNDKTVIDEKALAKLPDFMIKYLNRDRKNRTNPFYIAGIYGDICNEMSRRFVKEYFDKDKWSE